MPSSKSLFDISEIKIRDLAHQSQAQTGGSNIVTVEVPQEQSIQSFEANRLNDTKGIRYSDVLDGIQDSAIKKNARFRINELTRGPLSVEEEEEARIESEVQRRLQEKLEAIRESAIKEAYAAGFSEGKKEAKLEVKESVKPMFSAFENMIKDLDSSKQEIFKANEDFLLRMVYRIAKMIVLREIKDDAEYTKRLVLHLLERMGTRENVKVYVGEVAFSAAESLKEGLAQTLGELKNISIELDPEISGRGCRVETQFGEIDAQIQVQLDNIATTLGATAG